MGKDYDTLTKFIDLANYAGNNFAISTADVGNALQNSAAALQTNGVSMEQSVAMVTAMNEIVQDASKSGNALKTMSANFSGLTTSAKDGSIQLTKAGKTLKEIAGIEVWNQQTGEVKDMFTVVDELHSKWDGLSEAQRVALGSAVAGKTQLNTFNALMSNWETAKQLVDEYNQGLTIGSAEKENERYLDSIAGKVNTIKENMKGVANTLVTSDMAKGFLDGVIAVTNAIGKIASSDIGGAFLALSTGALTAVAGLKTMQLILNGLKLTSFATKIGDVVSGLGKFTGLSGGIKGAFTSLKTFCLSGVGMVSMLEAGLLALPLAIMAYDKYQQKVYQQGLSQSRERIASLKEEVNQQEAIAKSAKTIAEEYDALSTKSKKSAKEQERFAELTNQVAKLFPDLVSGYDSAGNPILALNGSLESYIANLERAIEKQNKLLNSEENKLADDLMKQGGAIDQLQAKMFATKRDMEAYSKLEPDLINPSSNKVDYDYYLKELKKYKDEEAKIYEEQVEQTQEYAKLMGEVREKYRNSLESQTGYKRATEDDKKEQQSILDNLNFLETSEAEARKVVRALSELDEEVVTNTSDLGEEFANNINKLESQYSKGTKNLSQYVDGIIDVYEKAEKMDVESFQNMLDGIKEYADVTGDLEGANAQVAKISDYLEEISGVDDGIWEKALSINYEPIEVAEKKLNNFLKTYGTGRQHLGKGGLADVLERDFEVMSQLPEDLAMEAQSQLNAGQDHLTKEFILDYTVDSPKPIQDVVQGMLFDDGEIDIEKELPVLIDVITELRDTGTISAETEQALRDVLPDEIEDEVIASIKMDVQNKQEMDAYLKSLEGIPKKVETEILMQADGKEEAEQIVKALEEIPEEKQIHAVSNYGKIKDEAYQLGVSLESIPTETLVKVAAEMDDGQIQTFLQALSQIDGKTVSAFLQTEGAIEALAQCETVQQMLDLINGKKTLAEIQVENGQAEEKAQATKQSLESAEGSYQADLMVQTNEGNLTYVAGQLYEIDGKTYMAVVNADTNTTELVEFNQEINSVPESKTSNISGNVTGKEDVQTLKTNIDDIPETTEATVTVKAEQPKGGLLNTIKGWFGKATGNSANTTTTSIEVTAKVGTVDTSSITSIEIKPIEIEARVGKVDTSSVSSINVKPIEIEARVGKVDASSISSISVPPIEVKANVGSALSQINSIKSSLSGIQTKNVTVTVGGNALSQVNSIKSSMAGIQSKSISINVSGNALGQINSIKSAIAGIQSKSIAISAAVSGTAQVNTLKTSIASLQGKSVSVSASTSGIGQVNALTSAIARVNSKSVSVTANVSGTGAVNALTSAINRVKSKSVSISARVSGTGAVQSLASAIASVRSKSATVSVTRRVTTVQSSVPARSASPMLANTSLSSIPVSMSAPVSISSSNAPTVSASDIPTVVNIPVSAKASTNSPFDISKILPSLDFDVNMFKNLEEALERLGGQIEFLNEKAEATFGQEKVNLLKQQIPLLKQQQKIQEQIAMGERSQNNELIYWLKNNGFKFDSLGNIENYSDKLLAMEQNVESLKDKYDSLSNSKNKDESATEKAKNAYESANETLDKTKKYLEEYFATNNEEITEASKKWWEYENAIREVEEAVRELANAQLELKIDSVSDSIDFLAAKMKNMNSQEKVKYLEEQNDLYREQQQLLHQLAEQMRSQLATLNPLSEEYAELSSEIMKLSTEWWDLQNSISDNLNSIFEEKSTNKLNNALENLENQIDFLDEKMNHYNGQTKIGYLEEQVKLYREQQNQMHLLADELRYQLTLLDPTSEQYQELSSEIMNLSTEWWKAEEAIKDATSEVEELNRQMKLLSVEAELEELDVLFTRLQFELDLIDEKMEYTWGTDKINAMKDSIELLNEQLDLQQEKLGLTNSRFAIYQDSLRKYNFQFDKMGNVTNYSEVLDLYKNSSQLEEIIDLYGEYKDIQEELQEQTLEYWKLDNKIKDLQMEKLEITEEIEEEITKVIEEQLEQRKQDIEDYTDERIKSLEKEKDAYKELRDEQDYKKSINEQVEEIAKLNQQIETARRDTTIGGAKRLKELTEELREAQEKLEEMTQDKIDSDYENNIDKEIERLEDQEENLLKNLEEKFSEENIGKMVAQALSLGVIEINGEVKSLQDAMIESINSSAEGYSVMAQVVKNELVSNLGIALETVRELDNIYSGLKLQDFGTPNVNINAVATPTSGTSTKNITVGDTNITIQGSVDNATLEEIEQLIKDSQDEMLQRIAQDL